MKSYDNVTFAFTGGAASSVSIEECDKALSFDAVLTSTDADRFDMLARQFPAQPSGAVVISMPWSILGNINVEVQVTGAGALDVSVRGASTTFEGEMRDRDLRRSVSMAVERAIVNRKAARWVVTRAMVHEQDAVRRMAWKLADSGWCPYDCERKRRKAMRRLLRAAGVTIENQPDIAWLSAPLSAEEQARVDSADTESGEPW